MLLFITEQFIFFKVQNNFMNFRNKLLRLYAILFKNRKFKSLCLLIPHLIINRKILDDDYKICSNKEAIELCDEYVLRQRVYLDEFKKRIIYFWSSRYYKDLNRYIRGYIFPAEIQKKQYDSFKRLLSDIIEESDGLIENTILFRGEKDVDVKSRFVVGELNTFVGFISTSFLKDVGERFLKSNRGNSFLLVIKANKGTKGIAINGKQLGKFANQYELLLNDGQKYVTEYIDFENNIIIIRLV